MLFQSFNKATRPETPAFLNAEIEAGKFRQQAKEQANSLRSGNVLGGAELYNEAMGDRSPIADKLFGKEPAAVPAASSAIPSAVPSVAPTAMTGAGVTGMGGTAASAPVVASAPVAAGPASGAMAAMGPAGWAAMAALLLNNL